MMIKKMIYNLNDNYKYKYMENENKWFNFYNKNNVNIDNINIIDLSKIKYHKSWNNFFNRDDIKEELIKIAIFLTNEIKSNKKILPEPDDLFNSFNQCKFNKTKVVILGQDPYFNIKNNKPEAMGLSFSVKDGTPHPSSLKNIFSNMYKFKHIEKYPTSGDLTPWSNQGVFLINTAFTVLENEKLSHSNIWNKFSDILLKYINDNKKKVVFVLWGSYALSKKELITNNNHKFVISSHPSGLSCHKPLGIYKEFANQNHFEEVNNFLKNKIDWKIL